MELPHKSTPGKMTISQVQIQLRHMESYLMGHHPALQRGSLVQQRTLYGRPTASLAQTNFTIYANNSGGSSTFILNLGVGPGPPGPFEYIPGTLGPITPRFTLHRDSSIKQLETVRYGKFMATTTVWTDFLEI